MARVINFLENLPEKPLVDFSPDTPLEYSVLLERDDMDAYAGSYEFKSDREHISVEIMLIGNKLFGQSDNDEIKVELYPETASQFYGKSPDIGGFKLKFVKNREGDINQFVLHCAPQFAFMSIPFDKIK